MKSLGYVLKVLKSTNILHLIYRESNVYKETSSTVFKPTEWNFVEHKYTRNRFCLQIYGDDSIPQENKTPDNLGVT